jgi:hypothetical protein
MRATFGVVTSRPSGVPCVPVTSLSVSIQLWGTGLSRDQGPNGPDACPARPARETGPATLNQEPVDDAVVAVLGRAIYGFRPGPYAPNLDERDPVPPPAVGADCAWGLPAAALPSEEFEGFLDELCVVLEDAAVAGVGVGHQLTVRQAAGQVG